MNFFKNLRNVLMKCKILIKQAFFLKLQCYIFNMVVEILFLKVISAIGSLDCIQHPGLFIWFMHFSEKEEKFSRFYLPRSVKSVIAFIIYGHSPKFIFMMQIQGRGWLEQANGEHKRGHKIVIACGGKNYYKFKYFISIPLKMEIKS